MDAASLALLAKNTVDFLKPALIAAGKKLAVDGVDAAREKFFGWLKSKFTKPSQIEAVGRAAQSPQNDEALEPLRQQILHALEDERFRNELVERLPRGIVPPGIVQKAKVKGDGNIVIQSTGSGHINVQH